MIDFKPLASSSAGCAYRVSCGDYAPLLIECGLPYRELREAMNYRITEVAGCLVSHAHQDHCKAAKDLLTRGIDVYASAEAWDQMWQIINHNRARLASPRETLQVGKWKALPFPAEHDSDGTLGFLIDSPEGDRLLYLTDSCYSRFTFPGMTMIAVECNHSVEILRERLAANSGDRSHLHRVAKTHMSLERLIELLQANDLSKVEAIHLLHLSGENSDEVAFKETVQRATGRPVYVAAEKAKVPA